MRCASRGRLHQRSSARRGNPLVLDRGHKTEFYQTVPSLAVLLLVHQDEARVEVWRRAPDWTVQFAGPGASIDLPELGGALAVAEIYARLGL